MRPVGQHRSIRAHRPALVRFGWPLAWLYVVSGAGCANFQLPRIDPSGERIFAPAPAPTGPPTVVAPPGAAVTGAALWAAPREGLSINPSQVVAPVGSEVIMIASVCGDEGFMLTSQRVEWLLAPGGAGQFVALGQRGALDCLSAIRGLPRKVTSSYAINTTSASDVRLDRGTATPTDDVLIQPGQAWVSVTSPVEGTSYVTAYGPTIRTWDRRQQTATIYWVDAQWNFPPPAINPVGTRHTFTTTLRRQTDGAPIAGWIIRYEIAGGPEAGFGPDGAKVAEVATSELGQASVEIAQQQPASGTNPIGIQVIRPPGNGDLGRRLVLGSGTTLKTWTSSDIAIRTTGPAQASVGSTLTYRIEVTNPGGIAAKDVVVTDEAPPGLTFLNSNPAANSSPSGQEWRLADLAPRQTQVIETNYRADRSGGVNYCASAMAQGGLSAKDCASTNIPAQSSAAAGARLELAVTGPQIAEVGQEVTFVIRVVNKGDAPASGLSITDRYDAGLVHAGDTSPIVRDLADLPPGGSRRINATFRVAQSGNLCQTIEISGAAGLLATTRFCTTAAAQGAEPSPTEPSPAEPSPAEPTPAESAPPRAAQPAARPPALAVKMNGPRQRRENEVAEFVIEVANTGGVPATNLKITYNYELTLQPQQATDGYEITANGLQWTIETLAPGKTIQRQVNCLCLKEATRACSRVTVVAEGGLPLADEACLEIVATRRPAPIAPEPRGAQPQSAQPGALSLSVADERDPIRVGGNTTYQISLTNKSQTSDKNVVLTVTLPAEVILVEAQGPVQAASTDRGVRFAPIAEIRAGETVNFRIEVQGDKPGRALLRAAVTSQRQKKPVLAEENTEILEK